jgi:hypothetical protein
MSAIHNLSPFFRLRLVLVSCILIVAVVLFFKRNDAPSSSEETASHDGGAELSPQPESEPAAKIERRADLLVWEKAVDEIIRTNENPDQVFSHLLQLVRTSPGPAQGVIAKHLSNLATDENFPQILPFLKDQSMHRRFHVVLAAELLNRKNSIKLPTLLDIAKTEWHPFREKAMTFLCQLTQKDAGDNWDQWSMIVDQILQEENKASAP